MWRKKRDTSLSCEEIFSLRVSIYYAVLCLLCTSSPEDYFYGLWRHLHTSLNSVLETLALSYKSAEAVTQISLLVDVEREREKEKVIEWEVDRREKVSVSMSESETYVQETHTHMKHEPLRERPCVCMSVSLPFPVCLSFFFSFSFSLSCPLLPSHPFLLFSKTTL